MTKKNKGVILFLLVFICSNGLQAGKYVGIGPTFRAMSFNVRRDGPEPEAKYKWSNRKEYASQMLKEFRPDILGLQEAMPNQIKDIQGALGSDYSWFGQGRKEPNKKPEQEEHNPIFYNIHKFELLKSETFGLGPSKKIGDREWSNTPRICTLGKFKDKDTGTVFWVYNTHLDHKSSQAQREGLKLIIADALERTNDGKEPVLFLGDFNRSMKEEKPSPLREAIAESTYPIFETRELSPNKVGADATANLQGWGGGGKWTIDYIFINRKEFFDLKSFMIIELKGVQISDHSAIALDFSFKKDV